MALPKLSTPQYTLKLPSTGKQVKYRPFLVKEEKLLLMAMESEDEKETIETIKTIIKSCTDIKQKVDELPTFDIEYLFLKIRAKSVGEKSKVILTCPDDNTTNVTVDIDLSDIEITSDPKHDKKIELSDTVGMVMRYPSLETFVKINITGTSDNQIDQVFELACDCIDHIYDENQVYDGADTPRKEKLEFLEQLSSEQFEKLQSFFETMPKLSKEVPVKNPKTGVESKVMLEGLASFFG